MNSDSRHATPGLPNVVPALLTRLTRAAALALAIGAATSATHAEVIYGVNGANQLVSFDSGNPNSLLTNVPITGATILNIDIRPLTGVLYGLSEVNDLYTLNLSTGVASLVGATTITGGFDYGFDFNPNADRIRVVTDAADNFRINQTAAGATTPDTDLTYVAGDPNVAATPALVGAAYTNNVPNATSTTLYGIDSNLNILARVTPQTNAGANAGTFETVGGLGIDATGLAGFDISGQTGTAYAALSTDSTTSQLYTVNLTSGTATLVGGIGSAAGTTILDIAAPVPVPEPSAAVLGGLGLLTLLARRRRAARA